MSYTSVPYDASHNPDVFHSSLYEMIKDQTSCSNNLCYQPRIFPLPKTYLTNGLILTFPPPNAVLTNGQRIYSLYQGLLTNQRAHVVSGHF